MILPNNGKVIIIDDNPDDVKNLAAALTREKMPFLFFKEIDMDDLPETPIDNVRLVFLDFDLGLGTTGIDTIRLLQQRLVRLITKCTPYVLVIWSAHEDKYAQMLQSEFDNDFGDYNPITTCSLQKEELQKYGADQAATVIKIIRERLKEQFSKFSSFNAFLLWESLVNNSAGSVTNKITSFYRNENVNWNDTTKFLLHKLAKAYSGIAGEGYDGLTRLKNALYTLSNPLIDDIDICINKTTDELFNDLVSKDEVKVANFNSMLNKTLLVSYQIDDILQPGNVYLQLNELNLRQEEINNTWKNKLVVLESVPAEKMSAEKKGEAKESIDKKYNVFLSEIKALIIDIKKDANNLINGCLNTIKLEAEKETRKRIFDESIYVDLNVTPICDFAQKKTSVYRFLPGILVKEEFKEYLITGTAYLYISDPVVHVLGDNYIFVFDFRFLHSIRDQDVQYQKPEFRLKHQLISDIQVKLSSHVSRSGIYFID